MRTDSQISSSTTQYDSCSQAGFAQLPVLARHRKATIPDRCSPSRWLTTCRSHLLQARTSIVGDGQNRSAIADRAMLDRCRRTFQARPNAMTPTIFCEPPSKRRASERKFSSIRSKSFACTTLFQPTPTGCKQVQMLRPNVKYASPFRAQHPLVPVGCQKVHRRADAHPSERHPAPGSHPETPESPARCACRTSVPTSIRHPLAYPTQLTEISRVRSSQVLQNLLRHSRVRTANRHRRASTPRARKFIQGYKLEGNSLANVTILSPACQGNPSATRPIPAVVLWHKGDLLAVRFPAASH